MLRSSRFRPFYTVSGALRAATLGVLVLGYSITSLDAVGQSRTFEGVTHVVDWPEKRISPQAAEAAPPLDYSEYSLLPFVDTLAVHYRISDSLGVPSMRFAIEWAIGQTGIRSGRRVDADRLPPDVYIESIDLVLPVLVREAIVGELFLPLDTINLGPSPSVTFVDIDNLSWDSVFVDTDGNETRAIFDAGFRLGEPRIVRVVFAAGEVASYEQVLGHRRYPPVEPQDRTVCIPDIDVWISWSGGRSRWAPPRGAVSKAGRDRRDEIGRPPLVDRSRARRGFDRTKEDDSNPAASEDAGNNSTADKPATGRDSDRSRSRGDRDSGDSGVDIADLLKPGDGDEDDDDDDRLYPAALAGVAAVGGVALFGGTIGYFGSASKAPLGLMSGYVEPDGGFLLHAAINTQVFGKQKGSENLVAGVTGFYNAFNSPIQPAIGIGVRLTEEGTDNVATEPSIAVGLAGNFGMFVFLAGYDFTTPDFRFGIAVNLRQMR